MTWIGYAWLLLRFLGIPQTSWPNLLLPLGGPLPTTEQRYLELLHLLRQNEHYRHGWKKDGIPSYHMQEGYGESQSAASAASDMLPGISPFEAPTSWGTDPEDADQQYPDEADSESSCSECSWASYPDDLDWDDENTVLNEVF